ncbi:MAG: GIY-YIG nuclease family protein [Mucilaginibacter sp.]
MNQYFVYILLCNDNSYYTGVTNNIDRRMYEHENGLDPNSYTHKRRPLKLVFQEMFTDINQAIAFEKQVKGWNRKKKEAIIAGNWEFLPALSVKVRKTWRIGLCAHASSASA